MTKDHWYRGYLIEKPEGCDYWNIREVDSNGVPDWCFTVGNAINLKEARETIDYLIEEQWKEFNGPSCGCRRYWKRLDKLTEREIQKLKSGEWNVRKESISGG